MYIFIFTEKSIITLKNHQKLFQYFSLFFNDFNLPLHTQHGIPVAVTMQRISSVSYSSQSINSICSQFAKYNYNISGIINKLIIIKT